MKNNKINLKKIIIQYYQMELECYKDIENVERKYRKLNNDDIKKLSEKIEVLPIDYRSILYFYYCFKFSISDIESILAVNQINEQRLYVEKLLSELMGYRDEWIDEHSLFAACEQTLAREAEEDVLELKSVSFPDKFE